MKCPEMSDPVEGVFKVNLSLFENLPRSIKTPLNDLFEEAWKQRELPPDKHIHPFMTAWNLLSYTAEITTGTRNDEEWYPAIRSDTAWERKFNQVIENPKSLLRMYSKRFAETWPIFDTASLLEKDCLQLESEPRSRTMETYRRIGITTFLPECWLRHLDEGSQPLPDWQHTLSGWFAIRKNLFRGPQWKNSENDTRIITSGFLSLIYFFKESKLYFESPSLKPDIFDRTQVLSSL